MIATLKFDLSKPEEQEEFARATKATQAYLALFDIANDIFRPARKHGYAEIDLTNLSEKTIKIIAILETKFYEILEDRGIHLDQELS